MTFAVFNWSENFQENKGVCNVSNGIFCQAMIYFIMSAAMSNFDFFV